LAHYNFREIPYDVIGGIFQRLIAPEERQKFGQFFTNEDIVDIINSFCIQRASDKVLDPACGSGSFLIRAYHRKGWLSEQRHSARRNADTHLTHQELLAGIYGCDIALFAAHLATLNLAARQINDEENYPYVARGNFFEVIEHRDSFYRVPTATRKRDGSREYRDVPLPCMDAIIGNPRTFVRKPSRSVRNSRSGRANPATRSNPARKTPRSTSRSWSLDSGPDSNSPAAAICTAISGRLPRHCSTRAVTSAS
jgi:hypothetical protein